MFPVAGILSHAAENTQLNGYDFSYGDAAVLRALVTAGIILFDVLSV